LILQRQIEQRRERRKCLDADIRLSCQKRGVRVCRPVEHPGRDFKPTICLPHQACSGRRQNDPCRRHHECKLGFTPAAQAIPGNNNLVGATKTAGVTYELRDQNTVTFGVRAQRVF
jgi:hypothetical protein